MKKAHSTKKKTILHYPQLDTVLMVENFIRDHGGEFRRKELWQKLPKRMMYQTFCVILDYLSESGKIATDREGKIVWTWNSDLAKKFAGRKDIFWKGDKEEDNMKTEISEIKKKVIPILKRHKARRAALFGSASRGTMKKNSDVDILIDIKDNISLVGFVEIKLELEEALKRKVDLVEYDTIKPALKEKILKEQVKIL